MSGGWHGQTAQNRAKAISPGRTYMYTQKNSIFRGPKMFLNWSLLYVYMCHIDLTRQAAKPPLFPGSRLYVLYVLYLTGNPLNIHSSRVPCYMCYMCYISQGNPLNIHSPRVPCYCAICAIWVLQGNPLNIHPPRVSCYMCYMCYILTREYYMCYIGAM